MTGRGDVVGDFRFLALLGMTRGGTVLFTLTFDSSPIKETFAKPTVIPAYAGMTVKGAWYDGRPMSLPLWIAGQSTE